MLDLNHFSDKIALFRIFCCRGDVFSSAFPMLHVAGVRRLGLIVSPDLGVRIARRKPGCVRLREIQLLLIVAAFRRMVSVQGPLRTSWNRKGHCAAQNRFR